MACTHEIWAGSDKLKSVDWFLEFPIWNCYVQGIPHQKSNIIFLGEAPRFSIIN